MGVRWASEIEGWTGVAHSQPSMRFLNDGTASDADGAAVESLAAEHPMFEWVDGVQFADSATGIIYEVVPAEGAAPRHYSETASRGALPTDPPPVSRMWLNARARLFLADRRGRRAIDMWAQRPTWADDAAPTRLPRPDDATLVALVLAGYESTGSSPRKMLAAEFGIGVNTADDWIKRARVVAPEHGAQIPAPTRGRPRKTTTNGADPR